MKLLKHPYELSACLLAVLVHILFIAYFATASVGNSVAGVMVPQVLNVSLQEERQFTPVRSQQAFSVARKGVSVTEKTSVSEHALLYQPTAALRGQHYFESRELTLKPLVAVDIPDNFTLLAPGAPEQVAVLRLLISEYGDVDSTLIEDTVLPAEAEEILSATFKKVKFHPGEINGRAVKSQLRILIRLGDEITAASNEVGLR
jgi:hypothetical protein